ncbi:uncharacterized protein LOC122510125 [Leptopilina heterotoma]|uniref:uncharacterized protein LOC122510125 n=1 Tax=Leptopilina heterotoma TaxID=63436 RepID=UPI001CA8A00F|nr:uncharacterized protein LOC122510125 [Leptopilina heterotoma]
MGEEDENATRSQLVDERLTELQQQLNRVTENIANLREVPRVNDYRHHKLPRFISNDPTFWFLQIESVFLNGRITAETTKANHVIAELDPEILICARDILSIRPTPGNIYTQIKNPIIANYSVSTETKLRQLLKEDIPTDGKPTLILTRLRGLGDAHCSEAIIKSVFLDQLPSSTRAILAASRV